MYKDCINKQKELEREESDGDNAEEELNEEKIIDAEKSDNNKPIRKRKRKQIKVHIYNFDNTYVCIIMFGPTYV